MDSLLTWCAPLVMGGGRIEATPSGARLILSSTSRVRYSDAQLDDYCGLLRRNFPHRPPLRLSLRARFSHEGRHHSPHVTRHVLSGSAGFGFWNNPFGPQSKIPALPQAIWFLYASPPSNMSLAVDVPGHGWKAACIDAGRPSALAWAPIAPLVMLACRSPKLYRAIWPRVQRALGIGESPLAFRQAALTDWHTRSPTASSRPDAPARTRASSTFNMTDWHTYELDWRRDGAHWWVDGALALETDRSPRGPLGFVAWIDNQYAVVTSQGNFRFGLLDTSLEQWIEIADVNVTREDVRT